MRARPPFLSFLKQKLADIGFLPIIVSEAATELMLSGVSISQMGRDAFQRQLLKLVIAKEDLFRDAARLMNHGHIVIICDRGVADLKAYMSSQEFDLLLGELGFTIVDLRDRRYDAVIFLHSVAVDAPEIYTQANNAARYETVDEAKAANARTLAAWTGHPHLHIMATARAWKRSRRKYCGRYARFWARRLRLRSNGSF